MTNRADTAEIVACVDVGGSGCQTVVFDADGGHEVREGAEQPRGAVLALAVPGTIDPAGLATAANLGWVATDPVLALGLAGPASVVLNDAAASALGESALRGGVDVVYVGLGTGVGGAVVIGGEVVADNLFGHAPGHGDRACSCGRRGCLETVAGGWALPVTLDTATLALIAASVAGAVRAERIASTGIVVLGGGITRSHPGLVTDVATALGDRTVEPSAAPASVKSAAAWGLRGAVGIVAECTKE